MAVHVVALAGSRWSGSVGDKRRPYMDEEGAVVSLYLMRLVVVADEHASACRYSMGAEKLATALRDAGHDVVAVTARGAADDTRPTSESLRIPGPSDANPARDRLRHRLAERHNRRLIASVCARWSSPPDAAVCVGLRATGLTPIMALQDALIPVVFLVEDAWPLQVAAPRQAPPERRVVGGCLSPAARRWRGVHAPYVLYGSAGVRQFVREQGVPLPDGPLLCAGVDTDDIIPRRFRAVAPGRPWSLLMTGEVDGVARTESAIAAVASLHHRGVASELVVAGTLPDSRYVDYLRKTADSFDIASRVRWAGALDRVGRFEAYARADVVLCVGVWSAEALARRAAEALASGVPVVTAGPSGLTAADDPFVMADRAHGAAIADRLVTFVNDAEGQRRHYDRGLAFARNQSLASYARTVAELAAGAANDVALLGRAFVPRALRATTLPPPPASFGHEARLLSS